MTDGALGRLEAALAQHAPLAVAVSGGVDSVTLAVVAHRALPGRVTMLHAVSPAVPRSATDRVEAYADREGWNLVVLDAGEFSDPRYRANPVNRCYYCKSNLYGRIRGQTAATIASGTNADDLGDFRPGLKAGEEQGVVHPFVETGFCKADIYALAAELELTDLAALPAQPCLASRVETGIRIIVADLAFVEALEARLQPLMAESEPVRVRVRAAGVAVEAGAPATADAAGRMSDLAAQACAEADRTFLGVEPYRRGSAFIRRVAG
ncbi:MAG TPA: adenine nucleotide alpha hydrolase [Mesorhizobium sp.]|jgi:uncharacterized protein|nr:adenine nucleotide alpha hydrolase [Mesorhizobium sp.]